MFPGRLNKVATVGTPHLGAPIADNFQNGYVNLFVSSLISDIVNTVDFFATHDPYFQFLLQSSPFNYGVILNYGVLLANAITPAILSAAAGPLDGPVYTDLRSNSAFLTSINGPANQTLEAALTKVSIRTQTTPNGAFAKFISPVPEPVIGLQYAIMFTALMFADYYRYHPDLYLRQFAGFWDQIFWDWYLMDASWHFIIGALGVNVSGYWVHKVSDGLIPWEKSAWGTTIDLGLSNGVEVLHRSQPAHIRVINQLSATLQGAFGILPRVVPPPPPPPPPGGCPPPVIFGCG